jgi:hypothetical protein
MIVGWDLSAVGHGVVFLSVTDSREILLSYDGSVFSFTQISVNA